MIALLDYGMGNLRSVQNALERLGAEVRRVSSADELVNGEKLLLPGVGAFRDAMAELRDRGFADALPSLVEDGTPLLGVCLGMQLLGTRSFEFGEHLGLDLIPGDVRWLETSPELRVPHMGWNGVDVAGESLLLRGLGEQPMFYFVHSYELVPDDPTVVTGTADYGRPVAATVERGNVYGAQFHPEKSQRAGLALLENFLAA